MCLEDGGMKGGDERQPRNAKVMEGECGGGRSVGKVGMKGYEENAVPGIENESGSEKGGSGERRGEEEKDLEGETV